MNEIEIPPLIDPVTGIVTLRLAPFHLDRLYGPLPVETIPRDARLPFPFLQDAAPVDVSLQGGMSPKDMRTPFEFRNSGSLDRNSWWSWAAFALTPLGWSRWPTPFFTDGKLTQIQLDIVADSDDASFDAMAQYMEATFGWLCQRTLGRAGWGPFRYPTEASRRVIRAALPWGTVSAYYEGRDFSAQLRVTWN